MLEHRVAIIVIGAVTPMDIVEIYDPTRFVAGFSLMDLFRQLDIDLAWWQHTMYSSEHRMFRAEGTNSAYQRHGNFLSLEPGGANCLDRVEHASLISTLALNMAEADPTDLDSDFPAKPGRARRLRRSRNTAKAISATLGRHHRRHEGKTFEWLKPHQRLEHTCSKATKDYRHDKANPPPPSVEDSLNARGFSDWEIDQMAYVLVTMENVTGIRMPVEVEDAFVCAMKMMLMDGISPVMGMFPRLPPAPPVRTPLGDVLKDKLFEAAFGPRRSLSGTA